MSHVDVKGWMDAGTMQMYSQAAYQAPNDAQFVEVGVFHGKSAIYLIEQLQSHNKEFKMSLVDVWIDNFHAFHKNMLERNLMHLVRPIRATSKLASMMFDNESCYCVYIDADHRYRYVVEDILCWKPKVCSGGWLTGHDFHLDSVRSAVYDVFSKDDIEVWQNTWVWRKP